jgi:uncharacterized iron-regulated membrane protein
MHAVADQDFPATLRYRLLWRWHFYAGLFVMPFLIVLAITGTLYCFQPQIEPLLYPERLLVKDTGQPRMRYDTLLARAQKVAPAGAIPVTVNVDTRPTRSAEFIFTLPAGGSESIYVNPYDGIVLGSLSVENRIMQQIRMVHRALLLGKTGEWVMELAGCWTLVMLGTGVALWWPRRPSRAMVLYPKRTASGRVWWKQLHAAAGIWLVVGALAFVLTGLPWSSTWGAWFKSVVTDVGAGYPVNAWSAVTVHSSLSTGEPGDEPGAGKAARTPAVSSNAMPGMVMDDLPVKQVPWAVGLTSVPPEPDPAAGRPTLPVDDVIAIAASKGVETGYQLVLPEGPRGVFTVSYFADDPQDERTLHIDRYSGRVLEDIDFHRYGIAAQAVSYGTNLHMGRYFGLANQILCALISMGLVLLAGSGFWMWIKRRPAGKLGAPSRPLSIPVMRGWVAGLALLGVIFPLLGMTLAAVWMLDQTWGKRHLPGRFSA